MLLRHSESIGRPQRFGLGKRPVVELVEDDAFSGEINEEGLAIMQKIADLAGTMHDEADGCLDLLVPHQPGRPVPFC